MKDGISKSIGDWVQLLTKLSGEYCLLWYKVRVYNWRQPPVNFIMNYNDYINFLAEIYEAEEEFWKEMYEDMVSDYWITENKNIF